MTVVEARSYSRISGATSDEAVTDRSGYFFRIAFAAACSCTGLA